MSASNRASGAGSPFLRETRPGLQRTGELIRKHFAGGACSAMSPPRRGGDLQQSRWGAEMSGRYLEDFAVGQTYGSGRLRVDEERIKSFAPSSIRSPFIWMPMPHEHRSSAVWQASGWHTAALTMRLLVESDLKPAGGIVGSGSMSCAGRGRCDPATSCGSRVRFSRCGRQIASATRNDQGADDRAQPNGEAVQVLIANLMVPRRSSNMAREVR